MSPLAGEQRRAATPDRIPTVSFAGGVGPWGRRSRGRALPVGGSNWGRGWPKEAARRCSSGGGGGAPAVVGGSGWAEELQGSEGKVVVCSIWEGEGRRQVLRGGLGGGGGHGGRRPFWVAAAAMSSGGRAWED